MSTCGEPCGWMAAIASMLAVNVVSRRLTSEGNKLNDLLDLEPESLTQEEASHA